MVSLDYPYAEFHDLSICYRALGWEVFENTDSPLAEDSSACIQLRMQRRPGTYAIVLYSAFDRNGRLIPRPPFQSAHGLVERMQSRLTTFSNRRLQNQPTASPPGEPPFLQVQIFVESYRPFDEQTLEEVRRLFRESLERIRVRFAAPPETRIAGTF